MPDTQSPAVAEITADSLITLFYKLNSIYRAQSTWIMNSTTAAVIRKLKNSQGDYIWQQGLAASQPDALLGRPISYWEDMDDVGTNRLPVAVGDFKRAYFLGDRHEMRVTVDPVTTVGKTKFYIRRRTYGVPLNNDSAKWLKTTIA